MIFLNNFKNKKVRDAYLASKPNTSLKKTNINNTNVNNTLNINKTNLNETSSPIKRALKKSDKSNISKLKFSKRITNLSNAKICSADKKSNFSPFITFSKNKLTVASSTPNSKPFYSLNGKKETSNLFLFIKRKLEQTNLDNKNYGTKLNENIAGKSKHFVPSIKEWFDSVYNYNNKTTTTLPVYDKAIYNLIKSYLNFYSLEATDITNGHTRYVQKKRKKRRRNYRHSLKRVIIGKPNFKHTNNDVKIIVYYYSNRIKLLENNISYTDYEAEENYNKFFDDIKKKTYVVNKYNKTYNDMENLKLNLNLNSCYKKSFIHLNDKIWENAADIRLIVNNNSIMKRAFNTVKLKKIFNSNKNLINLFNNSAKLKKVFGVYINFYNKKKIISSREIIIKFTKRFFSEQIKSVILRQSKYIEKSKLNKFYLLPLINLIEKVYKKKIEFSFINIKYIYNCASILTESLINKLKIKKIVLQTY